jgi:hypothetical protein
MLGIEFGRTQAYCDGVSRRSFLQIGTLGIAGITLPRLFQLEAWAGVGHSTKSVIHIHLSGGPSHQDLFDLKPKAPREFRGEFAPIATNVPGIEICEHMPQLARLADKYIIIRSLVGMVNDHTNFHTLTGYPQRDLAAVGGRPSFGSVAAKLLGESEGGAPPYVSYNGGSAGFLGPIYRPFTPSGNEMRLNARLTAERVEQRTELLHALDRLRRDMDRTGQMEALDQYTQRAVEVVTSGRVADALDINKEDKRVVERYGPQGRMFLLARRLVEVGVRVVTFSWGSWDTHSNNFTTLKRQLPQLDRALSALVEDLYDRGLDRDVTVVMWGEFGRTPRVNNSAGRDHWPQLATCWLSGGGMRTGQVIGSSTKYAETAQDRPVHLQEVIATLYHNLGIDVAKTQLIDPAGRPQYLLDRRTPITEIL